MRRTLQAGPTADTLVASYAQLAEDLLDNVTGVCLLDGKLRSLGQTGNLDAKFVASQLQASLCSGELRHGPAYIAQGSSACVTAIPLEQTDGAPLGVFCVQQPAPGAPQQSARHADATARRLKPVIDCLHRELAAARREPAKVRVLTERTAELEWLFRVTGGLKGAADERRVIEELLHAAAERLSQNGRCSASRKSAFAWRSDAVLRNRKRCVLFGSRRGNTSRPGCNGSSVRSW